MNAPDQQLCDHCHEQPATGILCFANGGGPAREPKNLCAACLMLVPEIADYHKRMEELARAGVCRYCGAPVKTGSFPPPLSINDYNGLACDECDAHRTELRERMKGMAMPALHDESARQLFIQNFSEMSQQTKVSIKRRSIEKKSEG